jgi:hypothetical protein
MHVTTLRRLAVLTLMSPLGLSGVALRGFSSPVHRLSRYSENMAEDEGTEKKH